MMEVIPFQESNIDALFEIQRAAYKPLYEKYQDHNTNPYLECKETVLQKYAREGTKGYIFIKDGVSVGAVRIQLFPDKKSGRISALGVLPQYQGQGIAQQALSVIEKLHKDVERWFLDTIGKNIKVEDAVSRHNLWMNCAKAGKYGVEFSSAEDGLKKCTADYNLANF